MTVHYFNNISVLTFILYTKSIILVIHKGLGFNFNINGFHALLFAARLSAYNCPKIKKKKKKKIIRNLLELYMQMKFGDLLSQWTGVSLSFTV